MGNVMRAVVVLGVLAATGAPAAWALQRKRPEWVRFAFEALALGLFAQLVIAFVALRSGHFSLLGLGCLTLAVVAGGAIAGWRFGPRAWPVMEGPWVLGSV